MNGKGDARRPIDEQDYRSNYDRIFGKKEEEKVDLTDDEPFHVKNAKYLINHKLKWEEEQKKKKK